MSATTKHPTKAKGMNFTTRKRISSAITSIVMIAIALICAIPLWYIVINTFKTIPDMSSNPLGLPKQWTFDNYTHAFATVPILRSLWNTLIVTFFGVAIQVIVGALAAYGMILRKSRFTAIIGTILMVAFVVPAQSTLIPLYRMEAQTHIVNTLGGLVLIYLGGCVFCYFLIVGYMRSLPFELIEAARIDGAGPLRIFWSIVMPLIRPILTTVVVFQTMSTWNDFMNANVFISSSNLRTIVLQVYNAVGQFSTDWPSFMTITVLALLPVFRVLHLLPEVDRLRPGRRIGQGLTKGRFMSIATTLNATSATDRDSLPHRVNDTALATNPLRRYCADPNLAIFDNRYFLYCTDDGVDEWRTTAFSVYASDDLATWERHPALDLYDVPWWHGEDGAWAPSIVHAADGRYVLFFVAGSQIGAAVADTPYGPFTPQPEPLIRKGTFDCHTIDPGVFIASEGTRWLLWGNGRAWVAPLRDDCLAFDESRAISWVPGDFREAIWIHERQGIYYASWSENDAREETYCVKYATSRSLSGPWSDPMPLVMPAPERGLYATGHHNIVNIPGTDEWIIAYHRFAFDPSGHASRWSGGDGCHRETVFAPLTHNADGTLAQVRPEVGSYVRPLR